MAAFPIVVPSKWCFVFCIGAEFLHLNTEHCAVHWKTWIQNKNRINQWMQRTRDSPVHGHGITKIVICLLCLLWSLNQSANSYQVRDLLVSSGPRKHAWLSSSVHLLIAPLPNHWFGNSVSPRYLAIVVNSFSFSFGYDFQLEVEIIRMMASVWHDRAELLIATNEFVDWIVFIL